MGGKFVTKILKQWLLTVLLLVLGTGVGFAAPPVPANPIPIEYVTGVVINIQPMEQTRKIQGVKSVEKATIRLTSGEESGKEVESTIYLMERPGFDVYPDVGDKIIVAISHDMSKKSYNVADYDRFSYVYYLIGAFILSLLAMGGRVGLKSIFVVFFAIFIILQGMIPMILKYHMNITLVTLIVSALIATVTQVTVSGWNSKTAGAILGTVGGVTVAGILAYLSIHLMHLTGLDSEEAIMLKVTYLAAVDFRDVLFAGVVLGALGAVMDVAISIASAQHEIKVSCPQFGFKELFTSGINVGRDVMGTMSNTLILAYMGSSLPLVLLLSAQSNVPFLRIMNLNLIVTEFARALTGSIGLICAIPLTALVTAWLLTRKN